MAKFRIQPHVRLQEWVADENGFFEDEGLDYVFETAGFVGGSASAIRSSSRSSGDRSTASR